MLVVTKNAVVKRINRKLAPQGLEVRKSRSGRERSNLGDFYLLEERSNAVLDSHLDLEGLAYRHNVLAPSEHVGE